MNKKLFSAALFGALLLGTASTFVSCKDYDDDIAGLQTQINDVKATVAALEAKVNAGKFVTGINSTADGITISLSDGSSYTVTNGKNGTNGAPGADGAPGTVITIDNDGFFVIDGETTPWKAVTSDGKVVKAPEVKNGLWVFFDDNGDEVVSSYRVAPVTAVQNADKSYTLTVYAEDGTSQVVKVPSAATLITSIKFADQGTTYYPFEISQATFTKPSQWYGEKSLPANKSVIFTTSDLDVRIDPVDAPATEVAYTLTNTKNKTLSNVELIAVPESGDNAITIGNIQSRANTGNGLYTLRMPQFILTKNEAAAFNKELVDVANAYITGPDATTLGLTAQTVWNNCAAFAVNANSTTRSAYAVALQIAVTPNLTAIRVPNTTTTATLGATSAAAGTGSLVASVNKTYSIAEIKTSTPPAIDESGRMYDMYFSVTEKDKQTYGVVVDNLNRTFKVTKNPDVSTAASGFPLKVTTLDTNGKIGYATINVTLDTKINAAASYEAVTYNINRLTDTPASNDSFVLDMGIMKNALGSDWAQWANSVDLSNTAYALYTSEGCESWNLAKANPTSMTFDLIDAYGSAANENNLKSLKVTPNKTNADGLKLDKQYYLKVTFMTGGATPTEVNNIVVPVTFTAPSVADQFVKKSGYTNATTGVIEAYFYDVTKHYVELKRYFDSVDAWATVWLDNNSAAKSLDSGEPFTSAKLATLSATTISTNLTLNSTATGAWGTSKAASTTNGTEFGYGTVLTVNAENANYANTGWAYTSEAETKYSFQIKVMSPIFEGTVKPVEGNTIKIKANNTDGFNITKAMITGADYNNNTYNVVPDVENSGDPTNTVANTVAAWKNNQIANVMVTKKGGIANTYINAIALKGAVAKTSTTPAVEGAINVTADPLPHAETTAIIVSVKDKWGYTIAKEVSVTIE